MKVMLAKAEFNGETITASCPYDERHEEDPEFMSYMKRRLRSMIVARIEERIGVTYRIDANPPLFPGVGE